MTAFHTPVRTCIGCRSREEWDSLVRLVVDVDSDPSTRPHIRVDPEHRLAGRGAWIHPTQQCWYKALQKNAFARAFRRPVAADRAPGPFAITESG